MHSTSRKVASTMTRSIRHLLATACTALVVLSWPGAPRLQAQGQTPAVAGETPKVNLTTGRSTVLTTDFDITRIAVTNPAIADALVVQPREVLIDGKAPGTISLIVWGADRRTQFDLIVQQPIASTRAAAAAAVSERGHPRGAERRRHRAVRTGVEHAADAAGGRGGPGRIAQGQHHQHAHRAGRQRCPAGDAAGAVRRGESARAPRGRCHALHHRHQGLRRPGHDAAVPGADFDRQRPGLQRLPQPVPLQHETWRGRPASCLAADGLFPEPGGTEPDRLQRAGGELPRRR